MNSSNASAALSNPQHQQVGLGGSCHWCTEAMFDSLEGVTQVIQGWYAAKPPLDAWSEAVHLEFDPTIITLHDLIDVHLHSHSCTSQHGFRGKYRSAVYCFSDEQQAGANKILHALQGQFDRPLVTRALIQQAFKPSPPHYQRYYQTDPNRPFCQTRISPKLKRLRHSHGNLMKSGWGQ